MYDTVSQYGQVLTDPVDDWHPPVMVRLWQLLHPLADGTAPMFLVQVATYALGFALIVSALVRTGRWRAGIAAAILGLSPLLLGWQMVILKDAQMLGALVAACGILAHFRLADRKISCNSAEFRTRSRKSNGCGSKASSAAQSARSSTNAAWKRTSSCARARW
jgi:hypothetical protein